MTTDEFIEVYRRIQAENKVMMINESHDEYEISAWMGKLTTDPNAADKLGYIIDRAYELWNHVMRTNKSRIEAIHANIKTVENNNNISLQP